MQENISQEILVLSSWVWMGSITYALLDCTAERIDIFQALDRARTSVDLLN